ncbi:MAG: amidohydrolase family protein [Lachnospiraceae bacterium]|nr:amidohydrolase family protein [Lachnospiraceae bacterium]
MKTAYIGGIILDGTKDMVPQKGKTVIVENGRISAILSADELVPSGCEIVNLKGCYLMPGLINLHVHLNSGGKPSGKKKEPEDYVRLVNLATSNPVTGEAVRALMRGYANTALHSGVTTIRTVGGISDYDGKLRNEIEEGYRKRVKTWKSEETSGGSGLADMIRKARTGMSRIPMGAAAPEGLGALVRGSAAGAAMPGPRILTSNTGISVPGGHVAGSLAYPVTSPEEAVEYVHKIAEGRPDLIKLMITGGIMDAVKEGEPGVLKMSPEIIEAACKAAHDLRLPVAAHTESTEGVIAGLRGGVDTIEHGAMPTDEMMELFKERGASLVTTISPVIPLALLKTSKTGVRPMDRYNAGIVLRGIIECARRALKEGIPVGLGTDTGCPYVTHYDMWRELQYFSTFCGVSETFALYSATLGNAKIAGIDAETGSIEVGKAADFLITAGNPIESLRALRKPKMVVARGALISDPVIKKNVGIEQTLDSLLKVSYDDLDRLIRKGQGR